MVRLGISVEGVTEERFTKRVLAPHLSLLNIYITPINLRGNISLDRIRGELEALAYSFDFVTTFYDFYGFKKLEPGETKNSLEQKIQHCLKTELQNKLIPYIQMHEFEGLLFSDPEILATLLHKPSLNEWATKVLLDFDNNPEQINNSRATAPSKRLEKHSDYRKTIHGPDIALNIGLEKLRNCCQGFDQWLQLLEALSPSS